VYPIIIEQLSPEVALWIPDVPAVKPVFEKLKLQEPNLPFPFWAKIWASSKAMVTFLQEEPNWIENKHVLEIGAGIGFPSFSIAHKANSIIISDYDWEAISLANKNIAHLNITNVIATVLDWNHMPEHINADTILLSDTNYEPADHNNLALLIDKFINEGSTIILATPNRFSSNPFIEKLSVYIHKTKKIRVADEETEVAIFILKNMSSRSH